MKIRTKISLSLLIILSILFSMAFIVYKETHEFHLQRQKIIVSRNLLLGATALRAAVWDRLLSTFQAAFVDGVKRSETKTLLEKKAIEDKFTNFKKLMEEEYLMHERLHNSSGTIKENVDDLQKSYLRLEEILSEALVSSEKNKTEEVKQVLINAREVFFADFIKKITFIINRETSEVNAESDRTERSISKLKKMAIIFSLFAFYLAIAMMYGITESLTTPLQKLEESAQEIYAGNLDVSLSVTGVDELANLSKTFNRMALSLKNNRDALEQQQVAIFESSKLATLGEMARGVAHEINSPLSAMILGAELIERKNSKLAEPNKDITKFANSIMNAGARVETIVKGLKGFARDAKEDDEDFFTVKHLINTTLDLCGEMLKANEVKVIIEESQMNTRIHSKITLLSQCLLNLITNAFEAVAPLEEKWVKIGVTVVDKEVEIRITDSGKGITDEVRKKMFRPMYTTKPIGSGPGLGLSVSRSIVTNFEGSIAYDENSDHTCFIIKLPFS